MDRGIDWKFNFAPSKGGKIKKKRPAVIISNDIANTYSNRVQVIPLTTQKLDKIYPCEALIASLGKKCKAMADQIMTVAKERLGEELGSVTEKETAEIEKAIKIQLGFI